MQRIRLTYSKGQEQKYIGHLDMVRLWERALRRTDLPVAYSEGFNPRQQLGFGPPLSLGITSDHELIDIYFVIWVNPEAVKEELNKALPKGIKIFEAKNIFLNLASITAAIKTAEYEAEFDGDVKSKIDEILGSKEIFVKRKEKQVNIRPMIKEILAENGKLTIKVQCDNFGTMKAGEIQNLFEGKIRNIKRTALLQ